MNKQVKIWLALLAIDIVLLGAWIIWRLTTQFSSVSPLEVSPIIVAGGLFAALLTLTTNQNRSESEDYLESAKDLIEKAYATLANSKDEEGRPANNRLTWLTSARLLLTSQTVAKQITVSSQKLIWKETQEYWRGQFRDLISPNGEGFACEYYATSPKDYLYCTSEKRQPLAESSLAVLYRFINWPEDKTDPLKGTPKFSKEEIEKMTNFGPRGLGELLQKARMEAGKFGKPTVK